MRLGMQRSFETSPDKKEEKRGYRSDEEDANDDDWSNEPNPLQEDGRKREAKAHRNK